MTKLYILSDIDDVIAHWRLGHIAKRDLICAERGVGPFQWPPQESWELRTGNPDMDEIILAALQHEELYSSLEMVEGAKDGLNELVKMGHHVSLCSAPATTNTLSSTQKFEWVAKHLGEEWTERLILTRDKTMVHGDYLIDDKPEITGALEPFWTHVVFDQPYNQNTPGPRVHNWTEVLEFVEEASRIDV